MFEKANLSVKEKKTDNAVKLYKQALEKDDKDFVLWTELGSAYFTQEKLSEAENSYNNALSLKNDFQTALLNLGKLYLHQKNYEKSIETLTKLLTLDAKSADAKGDGDAQADANTALLTGENGIKQLPDAEFDDATSSKPSRRQQKAAKLDEVTAH